ncbi:MSHA biogenesis protein MshI [Oceanisphaera litoralis]|uniref:MSHA biogenesis protein MshI n=1 Tax=Oceanisphaera litoralis TaxID=225144 RepID=UPI001EF7C7DA|nr:MSHA biogenesis protein MshI [Oceanisphaera litoralis]MBM7454769.1 MSHA biogenesis protein MshI [Oceanisphaera litoralis]
MGLISRWFKPARASSSVGVYLTPHCLVAIDERQPQQPVRREVGNGEPLIQALRALLNEQQWQGRRLHLVLSRYWYQQSQLDKPAMPDNELAQALPWCMRELVDQPVDSLLFDYIALPPSPTGQARIAVYSSERERLAELVQAVTPQCDIATIGVDELAMANLLEPGVRGLLLHKMPGQELILTFIHQRQWHFSRTIRGFQALDDEQMPVDQFVFDNLLLELQRSIDYAVGQLKLNTPNRWYLALPQRVTPAIQEAISQVFNIQSESLTSNTLSPISLPALGILREEQG